MFFNQHFRTLTGVLLVIGLVVLSMLLIFSISCQQPAPAPTPTPAPVPIPAPTPSPTPGQTVTINLSAQNISFDKSTITVPAGASVTVVFNNKDSVSHNFAVYETQEAKQVIFVGDISRYPRAEPVALYRSSKA